MPANRIINMGIKRIIFAVLCSFSLSQAAFQGNQYQYIDSESPNFSEEKAQEQLQKVMDFLEFEELLTGKEIYNAYGRKLELLRFLGQNEAYAEAYEKYVTHYPNFYTQFNYCMTIAIKASFEMRQECYRKAEALYRDYDDSEYYKFLLSSKLEASPKELGVFQDLLIRYLIDPQASVLSEMSALIQEYQSESSPKYQNLMRNIQGLLRYLVAQKVLTTEVETQILNSAH